MNTYYITKKTITPKRYSTVKTKSQKKNNLWSYRPFFKKNVKAHNSAKPIENIKKQAYLYLLYETTDLVNNKCYHILYG